MLHIPNTDNKPKCGTKSYNRWNFNIHVLDDEMKSKGYTEEMVDCKKCLGTVKRVKGAVITENLVGRILHDSWGYDMTFNEFWKIVSQTKSTVTAVKVGAELGPQDGYGYGAGTERVNPDKVINPLPVKFIARNYSSDFGSGTLYFKSGRFSATLLSESDEQRNWYWNRMD